MIEKTILANLISNEEFVRRALPFIKKEYFQDVTQQLLFNKISNYITKYNTNPTVEILTIEIDKDETIGETHFQQYNELLDELKFEKQNIDWLLDSTEEWCKEQAVYNAIMKSIHIIDGKEKQLDKGSIPDILSEALGVSFDEHIGHDFLDDYEARYEFYHKVENRIPFDIELLNTITKGGLPSKTLNVILAGTGVGKTLAMCHMAAANMMLGYNVLYITLEMAEERIAERIDANLLNVPLDHLEGLTKEKFETKVDGIRKKTVGKLVIKEYPTALCGVGHFRHLVNELSLKKNFQPSIIYVDYLNICASSRMKMSGSVNSYTYIKAIAEELRGFAVQKNVPVVTATQLNRTGYVNSDPGLEDTSESFGLPATADLMFALITTDELEQLDQIEVKQLKNRYYDVSKNRKFVIGVDRTKMRLYDVEQSAQHDIIDDKPVFDNSDFGEALKNRERLTRLFT